MKKIIVVIALALSPIWAVSQSAFDKYEDADNVASISINKGLLGMVANMSSDSQDKEAQEFIALAKSIDGIKVFISEDSKVSADMALTIKSYVKKSRMEELMRVKDGDTNVKFYIKSGRNADRVRELVMFVTGIDDKNNSDEGPHFETVLLTMTGDIDLNKIGSLTNKMNLPKELKKAKRGK